MISSVLHSQAGFLSAVELLSSSTVSGAVRPGAAPSPLLPVCAYSDTPSADGASRSAPGSACSSAIGEHRVFYWTSYCRLFLSIHVCFFLIFHHPSIHPSVCRPIEQSICLSRYPFIYQSTHPLTTYLYFCLSIHPSIYSTLYLSIPLFLYLPIHPPIHLSIPISIDNSFFKSANPSIRSFLYTCSSFHPSISLF